MIFSSTTSIFLCSFIIFCDGKVRRTRLEENYPHLEEKFLHLKEENSLLKEQINDIPEFDEMIWVRKGDLNSLKEKNARLKEENKHVKLTDDDAGLPEMLNFISSEYKTGDEEIFSNYEEGYYRLLDENKRLKVTKQEYVNEGILPNSYAHSDEVIMIRKSDYARLEEENAWLEKENEDFKILINGPP